MIRFDLICDHAHTFDGWFDSNNAFDDQLKRGFISCPICESEHVSKQLMAPGIPAKSNKAKMPKRIDEQAKNLLAGQQNPEMKELIKTVRKMRKEVEKTSENVGDNFAEEARKIHYKETPKRGIYGQATANEAKELIEEGVEVLPMPILPEDSN